MVATDTLTTQKPPKSEMELAQWVQLIRSRRVGPTTFFRMMKEHGSASRALDELPIIAQDAGLNDYAICQLTTAQAEIKRGRMAGGVIVPFGDPRYPKSLAQLADAPPILWMMGDLGILERPIVGLVGARNASSLGMRMATSLSRGIGEKGYTTVSGLARGIDTNVHQASLDSGTIAIMAGGVDVVYPPENAVLAQEISQTGLRVSEHPPGLQPIARHFPQRNRLISGIAKALVVVEAAARSGSLVTAKNALDQGRDVMAVPGHPFDARASGCNMLIRDGAALIRNVEDIHELVLADQNNVPVQPATTIPDANPLGAPTPVEPEAAHLPAPRRKRQLHRDIINLLGPTAISEDQLIRDLSLPASLVVPALTSLEMDGRVIRDQGGKIFCP